MRPLPAVSSMRHLLAVPLLAAALATFPPLAAAVGRVVELSVVDRATGQALPVYRHGGRWWIAGQPGARYAVELVNRNGGRSLAVLSVDGINAITGDTAALRQSGYVLDAGQHAQILGWRKSDERIAAFEFTALPDSYAARTGRPDNVGVIGIAVFRERTAPPPVAVTAPRAREFDSGAAERPRAEANAEAPAAPAADAATSRAAAPGGRLAQAPRLGTGHGAIETSVVTTTTFERATQEPVEVVTLYYDSRARLEAMGVIPPAPQPFPAARWVPDPPAR